MTTITINVKFEIGEMVYLTTDPDQMRRMVSGYSLRRDANIVYYVVCGEIETSHYDFELSGEKQLQL